MRKKGIWIMQAKNFLVLCFIICKDTASADAGIKPRTVAVNA
jgi:hypothetical protein